jgi:RimJ/RimL family protein N-acetyltransferase
MDSTTKEYTPASLELTTERLTLRPLAQTDAEMLWPHVSDPEISRDMSWQPHQQLSETQAFIDGVLKSMEQGKSITWCIFLDGEFCGLFSLIAIMRKHRALTYNKAELAYWAAKTFQGKGIMTEAGTKVIDFAFTQLGLNKLVVAHHDNNKNSEALILRLGFHYLYTEEESFMKNGSWITVRFYELKAKDYFKNSH